MKRIPVALLLSLFAAAACGGSAPSGAIEASGTVEATQADLAFPLAGRILSLAVQEGDRVATGQELGRLDPGELEGRRAAAVAQVAGARALLAELAAGVRTEELAQARLSFDAASRRLEEQERETARTVRLAEGGAVSREARERSETALSLARVERDRLAEQLQLLASGSRPERIAGQRAQVALAEAGLAQVEALLAQQRIMAPSAGVVSVRHREPGEVVGAGMPVLRIVNPAERWVRVYIRQDEIGRLSIGQQVTIASDGHPGATFAGVVAAIASEAEFTPRNVQTREERVKLVHAVRVRIVGDEALALKPGLSADVVFAPPAA